jgi:hypothetical protein
MRGALHSGFATLISRMSWRISSGVLGRPPRGLDFQRQARKPARCHLMMLSGLRIFTASKTSNRGYVISPGRLFAATVVRGRHQAGRLGNDGAISARSPRYSRAGALRRRGIG